MADRLTEIENQLDELEQQAVREVKQGEAVENRHFGNDTRSRNLYRRFKKLPKDERRDHVNRFGSN